MKFYVRNAQTGKHLKVDLDPAGDVYDLLDECSEQGWFSRGASLVASIDGEKMDGAKPLKKIDSEKTIVVGVREGDGSQSKGAEEAESELRKAAEDCMSEARARVREMKKSDDPKSVALTETLLKDAVDGGDTEDGLLSQLLKQMLQQKSSDEVVLREAGSGSGSDGGIDGEISAMEKRLAYECNFLGVKCKIDRATYIASDYSKHEEMSFNSEDAFRQSKEKNASSEYCLAGSVAPVFKSPWAMFSLEGKHQSGKAEVSFVKYPTYCDHSSLLQVCRVLFLRRRRRARGRVKPR